ncbi:alpha/beta fold hydrolase [Streptosporangium sp. NPDC049644]|uniref:alpha/beta fold hydrolase n=1 Tax=Streptosporangium sp. NPDC049644 TaxID=3155507 RepID=UPI003431905C
MELAYDEAGSGPAVLFAHAGMADRRMWQHQFLALSARHRVIRYDWRGYGESGDAAGEFARHEDLPAVLDTLGVERAARRHAGWTCHGRVTCRHWRGRWRRPPRRRSSSARFIGPPDRGDHRGDPR